MPVRWAWTDGFSDAESEHQDHRNPGIIWIAKNLRSGWGVSILDTSGSHGHDDENDYTCPDGVTGGGTLMRLVITRELTDGRRQPQRRMRRRGADIVLRVWR